jgi:hemin uptake protein HemP
MQPTHIEEPTQRPPAASRASAERTVSTKELLGGAHRIWIEHAAQRYLLQVTRSGKLILTK